MSRRNRRFVRVRDNTVALSCCAALRHCDIVSHGTSQSQCGEASLMSSRASPTYVCSTYAHNIALPTLPCHSLAPPCVLRT